jgi:hypothetical protein
LVELALAGLAKVFIVKGNDKYLPRSVQKGYIITSGIELIKNGKLFVFDDVTPLGIDYPKELIDVLIDNNQPCSLLSAEELARQLTPSLPVSDKLAVLAGGGILSYLFLKNSGYQGELLPELVYVARTYTNGVPSCVLNAKAKDAKIFLDDILASGRTIAKVVENYSQGDYSMIALLASSNVPKGVPDNEKKFRERQRSTIPGIEKLYCSLFVNGELKQKPAILSLRYLITKALSNGDYTKNYLAKKFGGVESSLEIAEILKKVDAEPLDYLRADPIAFLKNYGGL